MQILMEIIRKHIIFRLYYHVKTSRELLFYNNISIIMFDVLRTLLMVSVKVSRPHFSSSTKVEELMMEDGRLPLGSCVILQ